MGDTFVTGNSKHENQPFPTEKKKKRRFWSHKNSSSDVIGFYVVLFPPAIRIK
jgi:hypothetical protein